MQTLMKMKNKKGFTLVEVIVVMVIIAILAAMLLPSLTGYIKDANDKSAITEARVVYTAVQTIASERVGTKQDADIAATIAWIKSADAKKGTERIVTLTGIKSDKLGTVTTLTLTAEGAVDEFVYTLKGTGGKVVTLTDGKFVVS